MARHGEERNQRGEDVQVNYVSFKTDWKVD